jgi:hypothetical protein
MKATGSNALGRVLDNVLPSGSPPLPRGRWLVEPDATGYYWEPEADDPAPVAPAVLKRLKFRGKPPSGYRIETLVSERATRSGGKVLYTLESYLGNLASDRQAPSDTYNPFGRFTTGPSSFDPEPGIPQELLEELGKRDKAFSPIVERSTELTERKHPKTVKVATGEVLYLCSETNYGAFYSDTPPAQVAARASQDGSRRKNPASSGLDLAAAAEQARAVANEAITSGLIGAYSGEKRSQSQAQVMGASAGDAAAAAGFARNEGSGWEWLHLIAHSMGGIEIKGPQVAENLVAGTAECNTQMIIVEEFIKDYVKKWKGRAVLSVQVTMHDRDYHIGERIGYDLEAHNEADDAVEVSHWEFDALSRRNPIVVENRVQRTVGRDKLAGGGEAATLYQPRSQPTAHQQGAAAQPDPFETLAQETVTALRSGMTPDAFAVWLAAKRSQGGNSLDMRVFEVIASVLPPDQVDAYATALSTHVAPIAGKALAGWAKALREGGKPDPAASGPVFGNVVFLKKMAISTPPEFAKFLRSEQARLAGDAFDDTLYDAIRTALPPEQRKVWAEEIGKVFGPTAEARVKGA